MFYTEKSLFRIRNWQIFPFHINRRHLDLSACALDYNYQCVKTVPTQSRLCALINQQRENSQLNLTRGNKKVELKKKIKKIKILFDWLRFDLLSENVSGVGRLRWCAETFAKNTFFPLLWLIDTSFMSEIKLYLFLMLNKNGRKHLSVDSWRIILSANQTIQKIHFLNIPSVI